MIRCVSGAIFQPRPDLHAARDELLDLGQEGLRVEHHAAAEEAALPRVQDAGGDEVEHELLAATMIVCPALFPPA